MALPKRNRRKVIVSGVVYHWSKGSRGENGRGVATVQHATGVGAKLMIDPKGTIIYDDIPYAIMFALEHGWRPLESGPPFWIGFKSNAISYCSFVLRTATDVPYWKDPNQNVL